MYINTPKNILLQTMKCKKYVLSFKKEKKKKI